MSKKEKVVLLTNVENIGKKGEIKEVKFSFANNFLFPSGKAVLYDKERSELIRSQEASEKKQETLKLEEERKIYEQVNNKKLFFSLKGRQESAFGSVTATDIIRELKMKSSVLINRKMLKGFQKLRTAGSFQIEVRVSQSFTAYLQVLIRKD